MPDHGVQFETVYAPPYAGGVLEGNGRWFETSTGFTWTDDNGHLNFLDFNNSEAMKGFIAYKSALAGSELSASQVFDSIVEDEELEVHAGDLADLSKEYQSRINAEPITAAAPTEDDLKETASYGLTVDEDDTTVLELVKSDENGVYVRENETWTALDSEADEESTPTVYGAIWYDVTVDAIPVYDDGAEKDLQKSDFDTFIVP